MSTTERPRIKMLHDRILVSARNEAGERRARSGIVIPATAEMGRRLQWAQVAAVGDLVRHVSLGDTVLFDPQDRGEVEVGGEDFLLLRERDVHAVAQSDGEADSSTGLYL